MTETSAVSGRRVAARSVLLLIALLACTVTLGVLATMGVQRKPRAYAIIYARDHYDDRTRASGTEIWWQRLPDEAPRLVHTVRGFVSVPEDAGFLPSPDGRWLYVWEASRLLMVSVPDGAVTKVSRGQSRGSRPDPYWIDAAHLQLETDAGDTVFDAKRGKLTGALPTSSGTARSGSPRLGPRLQRAEAYVRRHCAEDVRCAADAMGEFAAEMGLDNYLDAGAHGGPDTLALMLARSLGIFETAGDRGVKRARPSLACSPNHRYVVRAAVLATGDAIGRKADGGGWRSGHMVEARLDMYDLVKREPLSNARYMLAGTFVEDGKPYVAIVPPEFGVPRFGDLRFSPDGRFCSYTAYDIQPPHGVPDMRFAASQVKVQGSSRHGFPSTGVYIRHTDWMMSDPCEDDASSRYEWLYFIPDAYNAFVVPAPASEAER